MDYLSLLFYPALAVLLFYRAARCKKGEWNEAFMSLDQTKALSGFCAIGIIFHHLSQRTCVSWIKTEAIVHGLDGFIYPGYLFVAVFFFCSGYGLFKSCKNKPGYFDHFFVRRAFPILFSAFVASFLFYIARRLMDVDYYFHSVFSIGGPSMLNTYGWYVIIILALYFLFYLGFSKGRKERTGILTVTIGIIALILFCDHFVYGTWWYNTMHLFPAGILFAKYEARITDLFKKFYVRILSASAVITVITFLIGNDLLPLYAMLARNYSYSIDRWLIFFCQLLSALFFVVSVMMIRMKIVIGNPALKLLGRATLEIYLLHGLFVQLFSYAFIDDEIKPLLYIRSVFLYTLAVLAISLPLAFALMFVRSRLCENAEHFLETAYDEIKRRLRKSLPVVLVLLVIYIIYAAATYASRNGDKDKILAKYAREHITYADTGGLKMAAYDVGDGPHTVVMLGETSDPMCVVTLRPIADGLAEKGNRVIILDYFGRLFSDRTTRPETGRERAKEIHEALGSLGVNGPFILWAHTTAGIYATQYIDLYPDEVEALVGADLFVGDAVYEMVKYYHSFGEMNRYMTRSGWQEVTNQKVKDVLNITNLEATAYANQMFYGHTKEEKAAIEAAYGRYFYNDAIAAEYEYFIDDMKEIAGKKLPPDLPSLDMLSHEAVKDDTICKNWSKLHENRITNPAIQTMVTAAYESGFIYYNYSYPLSKTQEFIESLDQGF